MTDADVAVRMLSWASSAGLVTLDYTCNEEFKVRHGCWCSNYDSCVAWIRLRNVYLARLGNAA